jgi:two-component system response regulator MprA
MRVNAEPVVLIVDDDESAYNLYSECLASSGFAVVGANCGDEAVGAALTHAPALIIMDFGPPLGAGCEATRRLRDDARTRHIPILALGASVGERSAAEARKAGCDQFLVKPCPLELLLSEARRLLEPLPAAAAPSLLLVEDDDEIRATLAAIFEAEGYAVAHARNGREALERLRDLRDAPRAIVLDLIMPEMNGLQFRERQLEDPLLARIPVVVLSATDDFRAHAGGLGVADYVCKPVEVARLLRAVERLVS